MSVLLGVLAVIGRILLILLIAVVALLLLVLLVPVRYRVRGEGDSRSGEAEGEASASWLAGALAVSFSFDRKAEDPDKRKKVKFTVFGINIGERRRKNEEKAKAKRKEEKKEKLDRLQNEDPQRYEELKREALARKAEREAEKAERRAEEEARRKAEKEAMRRAEDRRTRLKIRAQRNLSVMERAVRAIISAVRDGFGAVYRVLLWLCELPVRISGAVGHFFSSLADVTGRIAECISTVSDPRLISALKMVLRSVGKLFHHLRPRSSEGLFCFGCGDPATTGEVLAALSVLYPFTAGRIDICPDFEGKYAAGRISLAGRVILICPLVLLIGLAMKKDVRYLVHLIRSGGKNTKDAEQERMEERANG